MEFKNTPPEWTEEGVQPPDEIAKGQGWLAGYKPPASYFNWFFHKCYVCLKELQEKLSGVDKQHTDDVTAINKALELKAPLASPKLTGVPTAPTAAKGTATDQIATTKFVDDIVGAIDFSALQTHTVVVQNANINTLLDDQAYICVGTLLNAPVSNTYCVVRAYDTGSTNRVVQIVYVPQTDNTVRTFVRSVVSGSTFGKWLEITTTSYVNAEVDKLSTLIAENKFRSDALAFAMRKAILMLYIELFESTDDVDTSLGSGQAAITNYYNAETHTFEKNDDSTITIYSVAKVVTSGNNYIWGLLDWQDISGGNVSLAISRDNGVTYTDVTNDTLVNISSKPTGVTMRAKITMTGRCRLLNVAWGCK